MLETLFQSWTYNPSASYSFYETIEVPVADASEISGPKPNICVNYNTPEIRSGNPPQELGKNSYLNQQFPLSTTYLVVTGAEGKRIPY